MWDHMQGYQGMMGFGGIFILIFWLGLLVLLAAGLKWLFNTSRGERGASALEILNRRYAAGEIGEAEYQKMKERIGEGK